MPGLSFGHFRNLGFSKGPAILLQAMINPLFQALAEAAARNEPVALGIISGVKGSSPQKVGAKALFYSDGRICGTLGGGCLEAEVQQRAIQCLRASAPAKFDLLLDHDFGWDDGLICGGKVEGLILPHAERLGPEFWAQLAARQEELHWGVREDFTIGLENGATSAGDLPAGRDSWLYQETVRPPCALWIAGAGHIAQAVAPLAVQLDFATTVFDDRPALASRNYFPAPIGLQAEIWEKLLPLDPPKVPSFGLIVTRGHRHDALVLRHWIKKPFLFLGMIGSARKARTIFEHFHEENLATAEELARVTCPVGIPIESRTVPEIAVSIMAQFIQKRADLAPA
jgi:xanthine dehydrogenase accessory factor